MSVTGYSLIDYGGMIANAPRMDAYVEALRRSVTPGCHVVDIGAGPGAFALLACKFGAGSVTAIEPDASIEFARQAARANGCADRITFIRDLSTAWTPETRADVVISDIRGISPLFQTHIPTIMDMRERILAPGGVQIPGLDRLYVSLVETPKQWRYCDTPWRTNPYDIDLRAGLDFVTNARARVYIDSADALLAEPQVFTTLDYRTITRTDHSAELTLRSTRPGTAHGLLMWFETELIPGIGFSTAPGLPELVYGQSFLPFSAALELAEGTDVTAQISARLVDGDYIWSWNTTATDQHGQAHRFRQSTFKANLPDPKKLAARASGFKPAPSAQTRIDAWLLQRFDGQTDLATLGHGLRAAFPDAFATERAAFDHVAETSARYNPGESRLALRA